MLPTVDQLGVYLHLARASGLRRQPLARDRLLILAGALAEQLDLPRVAAYCRREVLMHNPGHMIRRWPSFVAAMADEDFLHLYRQIQRRYPQEKAEQMLASLGIEMGRERETYYSDAEYAAALLGISTASLDAMFGEASE